MKSSPFFANYQQQQSACCSSCSNNHSTVNHPKIDLLRPFFITFLITTLLGALDCDNPYENPFNDSKNAKGKISLSSENGRWEDTVFIDSTGQEITIKATIYLLRFITSATVTVTTETTGTDTILDSLFTRQESGDSRHCATTYVFNHPSRAVIKINVQRNDGSDPYTDSTVLYLYGATAHNETASLQDIRLSQGDLNPPFDPDTLTYHIILPFDDSLITIEPYPADTVAQVVIDGNDAPANVTLSRDTDTVTIIVTASDSQMTKTYLLVFNRTESNNAALARLIPSVGTLFPQFSPFTPTYTLLLGDTVTSLSFNAVSLDNKATVTVNGQSPESHFTLSSDATPAYSIAVTAANGSDSLTYIVSVSRTGSTIARCIAIEPSVGILVPAFHFDSVEYELRIPSEAVKIRLRPTAAHNNSTITVNGSGVISGTLSPEITCEQGQGTAIPVIVKSESGNNRKGYQITVNRAYTLSVSRIDSGSTSPAGEIDVHTGVPLAISATPTAWYHFTGWKIESGDVSIDDAKLPQTTVSVQSNATIRAIFAPDRYLLTMATIGTGETNPTSDSVDHGQEIIISAIPSGDCQPFKTWRTNNGNATIADTTAAKTTVKLTGSATVTAVFIESFDSMYVDSAATGQNSGVDWENAFIDLQSALGCAQNGKVILVAKGTYYPSATDNTVSFELKSGVKVYGGYPAGGGTRNVNVNASILSGEIQEDGIKENNSRTVVKATNVDSSCRIDGLTIQDGYGDDESGGGMDIDKSSIIINNCVFQHNCATIGGGALHITASSLPVKISNSIFNNNYALGEVVEGGAIYSSSAVDLSYCSFKANYCNGEHTAGGAIFVQNTIKITSHLLNCSFINNYCLATYGSSGGATALDNPSFVNCIFSGNRCISPTITQGAASSSSGSSAIYSNCTFSNNKCVNDNELKVGRGGALSPYELDSITIVNCIFWGNSADMENNLDLASSNKIIIKNNIIQNGYSNSSATIENIFTADPLLGSLDTTTGPVPFIPISPNSPARDMGTSNIPAGVDISKDIRGYSRSDGRPDIGAYEVQ